MTANREEKIAFEMEVNRRAVAAETITHEAMERLADAGIEPYHGIVSMMLASAFSHADQMDTEEELEFMSLLERFIDDRCSALETKGIDVSRYDVLRENLSG